MISFNTKSARTKLILYVTTIMLCTLTVVSFTVVVAYLKHSQNKLQEDSLKHLEILSYSISAAMEFNDDTSIMESIGLYENLREFVAIDVKDINGKVYVSRAFRRPRTRMLFWEN